MFEKEIHYHVKVEVEKQELESISDFNTVAVFSVLDPLQKGYLDGETIKIFLNKYTNRDQPTSKETINAILRRLSDNPDGRISFREFSLAITPEMAGLSEPAANMEFNTEMKQELEI